jgi:broad specificity phosphatase PhoE
MTESGADVYDRVSVFFETLYRDFNKPDYPENTLIVTHGMTLRIFLMRWLHWTVEEYESLENPNNCQVVVMEQDAHGKYQLITPLKKRILKKFALGHSKANGFNGLY